MEHLTEQDIARHVDESGTQEETRHLERCSTCRNELRALKAQTESLARLPDLRPPLGDWAALEARMISEGLVRRRTILGGLATTPSWMRTAAAILLFVAGAAVGAGLAGRTLRADAADLATAFTDAAARATSPDDAADLVLETERHYMDALVRYRRLAAQSGVEEAMSAERRYAALEGIVLASRAAVRQAPTDPFLNGVLASALAERQAVLHRISAGSTENWF